MCSDMKLRELREIIVDETSFFIKFRHDVGDDNSNHFIIVLENDRKGILGPKNKFNYS